MKKLIWIIIGVLCLALVVRLFQIEKIPGEWYGDISNVHEYEMQVLRGEWPFYFFQSPGPLYHYLIAPIVLLYRNHGFETYKLASIVISLIGLIGTFLFVKEITTVRLAFITTLTMSFSLWYLIWSRLGNSQIVIPALVSLMGLFIARYIKKQKFTDLFLAAGSASLGWYTYPQTFIFPMAFLLYIIFYLLRSHTGNSERSVEVSRIPLGFWTSQNDGFRLGSVMILMILMAIPFINIIQHDKGNFGPQGYVGEKVLPNLKLPIGQFIEKTLSNYKKVILMLHVKGDIAFRVNVSNHPLIDKVSGIFFLLGFLYFAKNKRKVWLFSILFMLLVLPLPSISPAIPDIEIPNSARTIATLPFVFLLVSAGFFWIYELFDRLIIRHSGERSDSRIRFWTSQNDKKRPSLLLITFLSFIYGFVVFSNLKLYFTDYASGLPDKNLGPGRIIANYIDNLPSNVSLYFSSCCWGEWGEPEPKGISYQLHNQNRFADFSKQIKDCSEIKNHPAVIVTDPRKIDLADKFMKCGAGSKVTDVISTDGIIVSKLVFVD